MSVPMLYTPPPADAVEIGDVARTIRSQWRAIIGFVLLGTVAAVLVVLFAPRRFDGRALLMARGGASAAGSILGRVSGIGDLIGGISGLGPASPIETELQVLKSRALAGEVVDSLRLQVELDDPRRMPAAAFVQALDFPGAFAPRTYVFTRGANGSYQATGDGIAPIEVRPGMPARLDVGSITLREQGLPPRLVARVFDREEAITRVGKHLEVTKAGGDVIRLNYRAADSATAAAVPNSLIAFYLNRRKTTDRGVNERRVDYITQQVEATSAELTAAERELRRFQESSRVIDAELVGKVQLEGAAGLRRALTEIQVDEGSIKQLLANAENGSITSRDLAAYPAFLRGTAANPMIAQLGELEADRTRLLERRTERDPEVVALDRSIKALEQNIVGMARTYAAAIGKQRADLEAQYDTLIAAVQLLPEAAERGGRLKRDVMRLTAIFTALQAQLVEARLGAIGEGGDVRTIDSAVPSREPAFPKPMLTMGLGLSGGLVAGVVAALILGWFGRWLRDPLEVERVTGVLAQRFEPDAPFLLAAASSARTLLVVPLDERAHAGAVAQGLARTAAARAVSSTVLDLTAPIMTAAGGNGVAPHPESDVASVAALIERMEQEYGMVVVQLPGLWTEATAAALRETRPVLLVAPPGPVDRARLSSAIDMLRRFGAPCAGIVMSGSMTGTRLRAFL